MIVCENAGCLDPIFVLNVIFILPMRSRTVEECMILIFGVQRIQDSSMAAAMLAVNLQVCCLRLLKLRICCYAHVTSVLLVLVDV